MKALRRRVRAPATIALANTHATSGQRGVDDHKTAATMAAFSGFAAMIQTFSR